LKSLHPRKDAIVHGVRNILLASQVFFRGLNRGVPEQKLYLLKIPSRLAAQFRARAPQIMGRQVFDADLVRVMQHDLPHRRGAQRGARHLIILSYRPKYLPLGDLRRDGCRLSLFNAMPVPILKDFHAWEPLEFCFIEYSFSVIKSPR
jgi:hypothetical protein